LAGGESKRAKNVFPRSKKALSGKDERDPQCLSVVYIEDRETAPQIALRALLQTMATKENSQQFYSIGTS